MLEETKLREWRPEDCSTRMGDVVRVGALVLLKVKCRRCSKRDGMEIFHYIRLDESEAVFSSDHPTPK